MSGSDRQASPTFQRLQKAGASLFLGHRSENIFGADLVVRSSAILDDNVEVQAALSAGVPVYKRVDFLPRLMAGQVGIAVAGTHGKTTTSAMIAWMMMDLGFDPSFVVGGVIENLGRNAHAGGGQYFVIEADEYDRMFLGIHPRIAVITNVEHDHPDCYPTWQDFYQAFQDFVARLEPGGVLVVCGDDPGAAQLACGSLTEGHKVLIYGIQGRNYDYRADRLAPNRIGGFTFTVKRGSSEIVPVVELQVPGEHNVLNALAALTVADVLGISMKDAINALEKFRGTSRRFEVRGEANGVTVVDDYAHHPTEIRSTLSAARARFPGRRIWAVWQPHTYTRTRTFLKDFVTSFADADYVLVTEVYAAREPVPADQFSAQQIVEAMSKSGEMSQSEVYFSPGLTEAINVLLDHLLPGDVVLVLSAGDANQISEQLLEALPASKPTPPGRSADGSNT